MGFKPVSDPSPLLSTLPAVQVSCWSIALCPGSAGRKDVGCGEEVAQHHHPRGGQDRAGAYISHCTGRDFGAVSRTLGADSFSWWQGSPSPSWIQEDVCWAVTAPGLGEAVGSYGHVGSFTPPWLGTGLLLLPCPCLGCSKRDEGCTNRCARPCVV